MKPGGPGGPWGPGPPKKPGGGGGMFRGGPDIGSGPGTGPGKAPEGKLGGNIPGIGRFGLPTKPGGGIIGPRCGGGGPTGAAKAGNIC